MPPRAEPPPPQLTHGPPFLHGSNVGNLASPELVRTKFVPRCEAAAQTPHCCPVWSALCRSAVHCGRTATELPVFKTVLAILTVLAVVAVGGLVKLPLLPFRMVRDLLRRQSATA